MKLWIDCEWNDFRGELISMALVADDGREFYQALPCANPSQWVAEHVMPVVNILINHGDYATAERMLRESLQRFLMGFDSVHIIADWPEDIERFCRALIVAPGLRINTPPLTMEILRIEGVSACPHNALADAIGFRAACMAKN